MNIPANRSDLERHIDLGVQESLHLDYKDSRALTKERRDEIVKDISAFANADGGILIFGITEKDHLPQALDDGVANDSIDREWIDQIIQANITPPITGVTIIQIPASDKASYFVIAVPKSFRGPHQASDKKYYKRYNFRSSPMDHYEIEDVIARRQRVPRLVVFDVEVDNHQFKLTCTNVGTDPVTDVTFSLPPDFKWPHGEMPKALANGLAYFPPGRKFGFNYCSVHEAFQSGGQIAPTFDVEVTYRRPELDLSIREVFKVELHDFLGTTVETEGAEAIARAIDRGFKMLRDTISNLRSRT
ncbi:MAG: ATP-binding protein [Methylotenera sp.]